LVYIHLNPVSAKMVTKAQDYYWSSYPCYIGEVKPPEWLFCSEILARFDEPRHEQYRLFVEEGIDEQTASFYDKKRIAPIFGTKEYCKTLSEKYLKNRLLDVEVPQHKLLNRQFQPSLTMIMQAVAGYYNVSVNDLKSPGQRYGNSARAMAIYLTATLTSLSLEEIAKAYTHISYSGVSHVKRSMLKQVATNSNMNYIASKIRNMIKASN